MKRLTQTRIGELYTLSQSLLWGLFPIFSILTFTSLPPLYSAALSTLIAAISFMTILTIQKKWHELGNKKAWKDIIILSFILGVLFYSLIFIGIQKTTAGNTSIILLFEIFFSMTILRVLKKEHLTRNQIMGAILMSVGAILVLFRGNFHLNQGDIIILIATAVPPIGNYYAQKARKLVSSATIMFVRSILAGLFILLLAIIFETTPTISDLSHSAIFILINGLIIMGFSKILWLEGIHRIPITKALSLSSIYPIFTLIAAYFILGEYPSLWQILGFIPIFIGIMMLTRK